MSHPATTRPRSEPLDRQHHPRYAFERHIAQLHRRAVGTGLTSNPTIFDSAIRSTALYDESIRQKARQGVSGEALFFELALEDLTRAADLFHPIHDATRGIDGFVSLEVWPLLADDTAGCVGEAKRLHSQAMRPNLFVHPRALARDLNEEVGTHRLGVDGFASPTEPAVSSASRGETSTIKKPSMPRVRVVDRAEQVRPPGRVTRASSKKSASLLRLPSLLADGLVQGGASDGAMEDRGVRRETQCAAGKHIAGDVVDPEALTEVV